MFVQNYYCALEYLCLDQFLKVNITPDISITILWRIRLFQTDFNLIREYPDLYTRNQGRIAVRSVHRTQFKGYYLIHLIYINSVIFTMRTTCLESFAGEFTVYTEKYILENHDKPQQTAIKCKILLESFWYRCIGKIFSCAFETDDLSFYKDLL